MVAVGLAIDFAGAVADRFGMFGSPGSRGLMGQLAGVRGLHRDLASRCAGWAGQAAAVTATAVEVMLAAVLPLGWQRRWFAKELPACS